MLSQKCKRDYSFLKCSQGLHQQGLNTTALTQYSGKQGLKARSRLSARDDQRKDYGRADITASLWRMGRQPSWVTEGLWRKERQGEVPPKRSVQGSVRSTWLRSGAKVRGASWTQVTKNWAHSLPVTGAASVSCESAGEQNRYSPSKAWKKGK